MCENTIFEKAYNSQAIIPKKSKQIFCYDFVAAVPFIFMSLARIFLHSFGFEKATQSSSKKLIKTFMTLHVSDRRQYALHLFEKIWRQFLSCFICSVKLTNIWACLQVNYPTCNADHNACERKAQRIHALAVGCKLDEKEKLMTVVESWCFFKNMFCGFELPWMVTALLFGNFAWRNTRLHNIQARTILF